MPHGMPATALLPLLGSVAAAPTSQTASPAGFADASGPIALAHESWEGVLNRFSLALVDPAARADEEPLFVPGGTVQRFGDPEATTPRVIAEQFDRFARASVCAFTHPSPGALARITTELAPEDSPLPPAARQALMPSPRERAAAQSTFARWIEDALAPQSGDRYGVVILVEPEAPAPALIPAIDLAAPATTASRTPFDRVTILLVKAAQQSDGRWRLAHVRYGTLVEAIQYGS